jgi:hypothetical protein
MIDHLLKRLFCLIPEDQERVDAIRDAMLDPTQRQLGRLDQVERGLTSEYEMFPEIAKLEELSIPVGGCGGRVDDDVDRRGVVHAEKRRTEDMPGALST